MTLDDAIEKAKARVAEKGQEFNRQADRSQRQEHETTHRRRSR